MALETVDLRFRTNSDAMSAFTVRLPTAVLNAACDIADKRQLTTGAVLRELIEAGIAQKASDDAVVPVSELRRLISAAEAFEPHQHRDSRLRRALPSADEIGAAA